MKSLRNSMKATEQHFRSTAYYAIVGDPSLLCVTILRLLIIAFMWCCLLWCMMWFQIVRLWMKFESVSIEMKINCFR